MTNSIKKAITASALCLSLLASFPTRAQEVIEIDPLFEYPSAPEELTSLEDKSDYLVDHFWDLMDFKAKATVDQNALNDAFRVYSVPMRWADKERSLASTDKLIEKISKNPTLLIQFTKAAEEALYGPRASVWIDEVYVRFLKAIVSNKKVPEARKTKYKAQLKVLEKSMLGATAPEFDFTGRDGKKQTYFPMTTPTMIIFGNPTLPEWRMTRLKMETNTALTQALEKGKANIIFIVTQEMPDWQKEVANYPSTWTVGIAPEVGETYDFRTTPSFYVIGSDGKILLKNAAPESAVWELLNQVKP